MNGESQWHFWIDTGGTFTDCLARTPGGQTRRLKVLSSGAVRARVQARLTPSKLRLGNLPVVSDGFFAGFRIAAPLACGGMGVVDWDARARVATLSGAVGPDVSTGDIIDLATGEEAPLLAMRILSGARPGVPLPAANLRLATTRGTNALLEGRTAPCAFFVTAGFGDLLRIGDQRRVELFALNPSKPPVFHGPVVEVGERLAADGKVVTPLDVESVREAAMTLLGSGVRVAAIALLHSYRNPAHEQALAEFLRRIGFAHVSVSSDLAPMIKIVPRAATAVVDAILSPVMNDYLDGVACGVGGGRFQVMTSAGGLVDRSSYRAKDSLLSGPAGGVVGAATVARRAGLSRIIGFDMGGTSTDVARFEGDYDYQFEHTVGGARVFAPALRLETVAAGGGSLCRFDGAALVVGPDSAGADPGPACYGRGGPLTLTDVHLLLGRLSADFFAVPVFPEAAEQRLEEVRAAVASAGGRSPERQSLLKGWLAIADERMADAIRRISLREGYDPAEYTLVAFGGAGGLHACAVAERLGMRQVLFPSDSGLLSAAGLSEAVPERFAERLILQPFDVACAGLSSLLGQLTEDAFRLLGAEGVPEGRMERRRAELELRFAGQEAVLVVGIDPVETVRQRFLADYRSRFGYIPEHKPIEVVSARVVVSEARENPADECFEPDAARGGVDRVTGAVLSRAALRMGQAVEGSAVIQDEFSTLYVPAGWRGMVGSAGSILLECRDARSVSPAVSRPEVVDLELFTCRFLSLVEEMGVLLQRCAVSVNVKERLDYSCALLDPDGRLVANAPHIPVHLGAMGMCVRSVRETLALEAGDVAVTNHPAFGGSHLPDVTLIAPVHDAAGCLIGYVANRAHHAEIGGVRPGSMPPDARCLKQEGVVIPPGYLVRRGKADWETLRRRLSSGPNPSRAVDENLADLHAQLASILRGVNGLKQLISVSGRRTVRRFMDLLRRRSAEALTGAMEPLMGCVMEAADTMDDGTPIAVRCEAGPSGLTVDFTGSGGVHAGNLNATPAIVHSAVVYVLRVLAGRDLPLNEGLLRDVTLVIPPGLLSPRFPGAPGSCPAVVGGNVETSQRVVDVLVRALRLAACSQGTMNNVTFGSDRFRCYETLGGGAGATPGADGCSAVHVHMTNTAITDPEVMEVRLPVRLERFAIRRNSGGRGRHRGGDGIERWIRFLEPAELSLLTQRRHCGPPGVDGGMPGQPGRQWIDRADGSRESLAGVVATRVMPGDVLVVQTPGGGGWGPEAERSGDAASLSD